MAESAIPGYGLVNLADLDRMASMAADRAAAQARESAISREDVEEMLEKGIDRFLERLGIDDVKEFRKDLSAMRASRETKDAIVSHGLRAVVTVLAGGICTAIWWAVKGVK